MEPMLVLVAGKGEGRVWAAHPAWTVWGQWQPCCLLRQERNKNAAQELATLLLSLPAPASVQQQSKSLLASLHTSRSAYHSHKVIRASSVEVDVVALAGEQVSWPFGRSKGGAESGGERRALRSDPHSL